MAAKSSIILCVLVIWVVVVSAHGAGHHSHAPAPSADCSNLILNMADCLSFVSNGSNATKPEGHCCSGLKTVLKADPSCLCEAFKSSSQLGVVLNVTKASTLPGACKTSAPSITNCGLSVTPAAAPGGGFAPASSPKSSAAAPGLHGSASELSPAPAPSPGNSASSVLLISAGSLLVCLSAAIFSGF